MDIKEFLLARIAEDEEMADTFHEKYCGWCLHQGPGFNEDGCICGHPQKLIRECTAKRAIIDAFDPEAPFNDPYVGHPLLGMLAAVYSDHPDYQPEWALNG